jgi:hypothetical protein
MIHSELHVTVKKNKYNHIKAPLFGAFLFCNFTIIKPTEVT